MIIVTGGSASGKSEYAGKLAERLSEDYPDHREILYIATLADRSEESGQRIERHRKLRCHGTYEVIECFSLEKLKSLGNDRTGRESASGSKLENENVRKGVVLFDSLDGFTADVLFGTVENSVPHLDLDRLTEETVDALKLLDDVSEVLIIVSDAMYSDGFQYDKEIRRYMEYTSGTELLLADEADHVVEVVCGIPLLLKGENHEFLQISDNNVVFVYEDSHALD